MLPVLLTIGSWPISSFGLFLTIALFAASFVIWRLCRIYDINEEQAIDLILLTFFGGLIVARLYFVFTHSTFFINSAAQTELSWVDKSIRVLLINRFPGLSFWGGFLGGGVTLLALSRRFRLSPWVITDFAFVGFFIGLAISSFGCFLGSCQPGQVSTLPIAVSMVGLVGKRFPLQVVESLVFLIGFWLLWRNIVKFHFTGKITALGLILFGLIKLGLEFFRGDLQILFPPFSLGALISIFCIIGGVLVLYIKGERSIRTDFRNLAQVVINSQKRSLALSKLAKRWYNQRIYWRVSLTNFRRTIRRKLNIRSNPTEF